MPLSPAEVHNVAFKKPPIGKRGYDEEEVDAFLDIVEVELARLIEENNELRSGGAAGAGDGEPRPVAATGDGGADLAAAQEENGRLRSRVEELERTLNEGENGAAQQLVQLQQQLSQTEQQLAENRRQLEQAQQNLAQAQQAAQRAAQQQRSQQDGEAQGAGLAPAEHHQQAVQMLALAQQTADQHLAQSRAEADRLVTEAQAQAQATIADADERSARQLADAEGRARRLHEESAGRATQTVQDAEQRAATITSQFEQRKAALERRVEELRTFEREYRTRLKSYLESQLRDLDASGRAEPVNASADANSELVEAQQG